jgi:hypothetical protein
MWEMFCVAEELSASRTLPHARHYALPVGTVHPTLRAVGSQQARYGTATDPAPQ